MKEQFTNIKNQLVDLKHVCLYQLVTVINLIIICSISSPGIELVRNRDLKGHM